MSQSLSRTRLAAGVGTASLAALSVVALVASVLVGVAYSADPPLSPPVGAPQDNVRCVGTVANVSVDNVVVPKGAACVLAGTQVRGSVLAKQDSSLLVLPGTHVFGNLEAKGSALVLIGGSRIGGNFKCDGCKPRSLGSSAVGGNVQIVGALETAFISTTDVGGDVEIAATVAVFPSITVSSSAIDGDLKLEKNAASVFVTSNTVGGNLQSIEGLHGILTFNSVGGNMQVFKNQSAIPTTITANTIAEALQCQENQPPPVAFINAARSFEGQCGPPS